MGLDGFSVDTSREMSSTYSSLYNIIIHIMFLKIKMFLECLLLIMLKFGRPIEDANPLLGREEFLKNMIVEPMNQYAVKP